MTEAVLEVESLDVEFPRYDLPPVRAVRGLDLSIDPQEIVGLVGESGAGKTTLARAIMQLVPPPGRIAPARVTLSTGTAAESHRHPLDRSAPSLSTHEWCVRRVSGRAQPSGRAAPGRPEDRPLPRSEIYHVSEKGDRP